MRFGNAFFSDGYIFDAEWLSDEIARVDSRGERGISLGHGWCEHYQWLERCGFKIAMYASGCIVRW